MLATVGLAFLAGLLSALSPCVMPLVPLVVGAAASEHRFGAAALAAGLALSFTAIGLFVATIGFAIGLDAAVFRDIAAVLMIGVGLVLAVPVFQTRLAVASGPIGDWAESRFGGARRTGLFGQFSVGLLLGVVWAPCAGPTLGAASILAAKGQDLSQVTATMLAFGIGAPLPLLVLGRLSSETMRRLRGRVVAAGTGARIALGVILVALGLLVLTDFDRQIETVLVEASPAWLTDLTTRF